MKKLLVIHGPNLNLLGQRDTDIYGKLTLSEIDDHIINYARQHNVDVECMQYNSETDIINALQGASNIEGIILNPAAFTHTSVAIRDAIDAITLPVVEIHISNIHNREDFRQTSLTAGVCIGQIVGFGWRGYLLAVDYFIHQH